MTEGQRATVVAFLQKTPPPLTPNWFWCTGVPGDFVIIHRYARLTPEEQHELVQWSAAMRDSMKVKFPVDSRERKPKK